MQALSLKRITAQYRVFDFGQSPLVFRENSSTVQSCLGKLIRVFLFQAQKFEPFGAGYVI